MHNMCFKHKKLIKNNFSLFTIFILIFLHNSNSLYGNINVESSNHIVEMEIPENENDKYTEEEGLNESISTESTSDNILKSDKSIKINKNLKEYDQIVDNLEIYESLDKDSNINNEQNLIEIIVYHENGKIKSTGYYKDGKKIDEWRHYHENGKLKSAYNHSTDVLKTYYENGQIKSVGNIENNFKNGEWKIYYENGFLASTGEYSENKKDGEWKYFHENGRPFSVGAYANDKEVGEWKVYHRNGYLSSEGTYREGHPYGEWNFYYENGKLKNTVNDSDRSPTNDASKKIDIEATDFEELDTSVDMDNISESYLVEKIDNIDNNEDKIDTSKISEEITTIKSENTEE